MYGLRTLDHESGQLPDGSHQDSTRKLISIRREKTLLHALKKLGMDLEPCIAVEKTKLGIWRENNGIVVQTSSAWPRVKC